MTPVFGLCNCMVGVALEIGKAVSVAGLRFEVYVSLRCLIHAEWNSNSGNSEVWLVTSSWDLKENRWC